MSRMSRTLLVLTCVSLVALWFSGYGRPVEESNQLVRYDGKTLIVEGKVWVRQGAWRSDPPFAQGRILLRWRAPFRAEFDELLKRYSLCLIDTRPGDIAAVAVPAGFEYQWANALSVEPPVDYAAMDTENLQATTQCTPRPQVAEAKGIPVPEEEPSELVVRKLVFEQYQEIKDAGGLPVMSTATGRQTVLNPTVYDVRKETCARIPQSPPGNYECEVVIRISLSPDGSDPSEQGARISVKWDPSGKWVR